MVNRVRIFVGLISVLVLASVVVAQEEGWIRLTTKDQSMVIDMPKGYIKVDDKDPAFQEVQKTLVRDNPKIAQMVEHSKQQDYQLYCMDVTDDGSDGFVDNMNLIVNAKAEITERLFPDLGAQMLENIPFKAGAIHKIIQTKVGNVLRYQGTIEVVTGDVKTLVDLCGNIFLHDGKLYILTFGCGGGQLKGKLKSYDRAIATIKFP